MVSRQRGRVSEHLAHSTGQEVFLFSEYCGLWTGTGTAEVSSHKACPCAVCCRMEAWSWNSNRILEVLWKTLAWFCTEWWGKCLRREWHKKRAGKDTRKKKVWLSENQLIAKSSCGFRLHMWGRPGRLRGGAGRRGTCCFNLPDFIEKLNRSIKNGDVFI